MAAQQQRDLLDRPLHLRRWRQLTRLRGGLEQACLRFAVVALGQMQAGDARPAPANAATTDAGVEQRVADACHVADLQSFASLAESGSRQKNAQAVVRRFAVNSICVRQLLPSSVETSPRHRNDSAWMSRKLQRIASPASLRPVWMISQPSARPIIEE